MYYVKPAVEQEWFGMSKITELQEKHRKEIDALQAKCKHKKLSKWIPVEWASGHYASINLKVCEDCGKIVKRHKVELQN
jgi:hypothetical protein